MSLDQIAQWATIWAAILGFSVPLCALAYSAVSFIRLRKREQQREQYQRFFEVLESLGKHGGSVASQMGAVFEMRKFPEYKDVIIRLLEPVSGGGNTESMLKDEMALTVAHLRKRNS